MEVWWFSINFLMNLMKLGDSLGVHWVVRPCERRQLFRSGAIFEWFSSDFEWCSTAFRLFSDWIWSILRRSTWITKGRATTCWSRAACVTFHSKNDHFTLNVTVSLLTKCWFWWWKSCASEWWRKNHERNGPKWPEMQVPFLAPQHSTHPWTLLLHCYCSC